MCQNVNERKMEVNINICVEKIKVYNLHSAMIKSAIFMQGGIQLIKKKWRKGIAAFGTVAMLSSLTIGAHAFQMEQQGSNLVISGTGAAGKSVSVMLVKTADGEYLDKVFALDETVVKPDGTYEIMVLIPDTKDGISANGDFDLTVRVGDATAETGQITGYISEAFRNQCVGQFKSKPASELNAFLALGETVAVMKILGVDMDTYAALSDGVGGDKERAIAILDASGTRSAFTEDDIRINTNKAIYIASLLNGDAGKALNGINASFETVAYKDIADSALKTYLVTSMTGKTFASFAEYDTAYAQYNIFYKLNSANPTAMAGYLSSYATALGIDTDSAYLNYQASTNQTGICTALVTALAETPVSSVQDFLLALSNAVANPGGGDNETTETGNGSGSFGGGGGGGGGGFSAPTTVISKPEPQATQKPAEDANPVFNDLSGFDWAEEAILALNARGIVAGDGKGKYNPSNNVTREEFSKLLTLALGLQNPNATCAFTDTPEDAWYYLYVASLNQAGIINGVGDGKFGTGAGLTREDMTVMIYNAMQKTGKNITQIRSEKFFKDGGSISDYAKEAIKVMYSAGKVNGTGESFEPKRFCTRAEAAKIIYDALVKGE